MRYVYGMIMNYDLIYDTMNRQTIFFFFFFVLHKNEGTAHKRFRYRQKKRIEMLLLLMCRRTQNCDCEKHKVIFESSKIIIPSWRCSFWLDCVLILACSMFVFMWLSQHYTCFSTLQNDSRNMCIFQYFHSQFYFIMKKSEKITCSRATVFTVQFKERN